MIKNITKTLFRGSTSKQAKIWRALAVLVILLMPVRPAMAFEPISATIALFTGLTVGAALILFVPWALYTVVLTPLAWLLAGLGTAVNWVIAPSPIITSSVVQIGWTVTRDFANMFFILILHGIALDFILFNSFGVKKALPTLLLVALLINFSLPIAGILIDFANVFTGFFLSKVSENCGVTELLNGQSCAFTQKIAKSLGFARIFDNVASASGVANTLSSALAPLTTIIFAIYFILGTISVFFALFFMFLTRLGYLYVLLVILPIVLVAYAFPPTSKYFGTWKDSFFKWVMFAPAASFFLYLSLLVLSANVASDFKTATAGAEDSPFFNMVFTYLIAWTFMGGSLVAAQKMGIATAGALAAVETAVRGKTKILRNKAFGKLDDKLGKYGTKGAIRLAAKVPFAGGYIAKGIAGVATKLRTAKTEAAELTKEEQNLVSNGSEEVATNLIQSYSKGTLDQRAKVGKMIILAEKNKTFKIRDAEGIVDSKAMTALKRTARAQAKKVNDIATVKAIDQSDLTIAEEALNEKYGFNSEANNGKGVYTDPNRIDPDTGKKMKEIHERKLEDLYRKIDFGKEDFDQSMVDDKFTRKLVKYGGLTQERFKQAQRSGNRVIMDTFKKYMKDMGEDPIITGEFMNQKNNALRSWLKKTAAQDFLGEDYSKLIINLERAAKGAKPGKTQSNTAESKAESKLEEELADWKKKKGYKTKEEEAEEEEENNE